MYLISISSIFGHQYLIKPGFTLDTNIPHGNSSCLKAFIIPSIAYLEALYEPIDGFDVKPATDDKLIILNVEY